MAWWLWHMWGNTKFTTAQLAVVHPGLVVGFSIANSYDTDVVFRARQQCTSQLFSPSFNTRMPMVVCKPKLLPTVSCRLTNVCISKHGHAVAVAPPNCLFTLQVAVAAAFCMCVSQPIQLGQLSQAVAYSHGEQATRGRDWVDGKLRSRWFLTLPK